MRTYKYEAFIFDGYAMSDDIIVYRGEKDEEFAPIKNKEGSETAESAIALYKAFYNMK